MILWSLVYVPLLFGLAIWCGGNLSPATGESRRAQLGGSAALAMLVLFILALTAAFQGGDFSLRWAGPLMLHIAMVPMVKVASVMIPLIALPIILWAAAAESLDGLPKLLGLLVVFCGAMELLVVAADLLVVAIAWELLGFLSWLLIAHQWQHDGKVKAANYSFNATRLGGLGLWLAAAAALATSGSLDFAALSASSTGAWSHWMAAGILAAAASKSAQGPFAPWLFRAMEGPSSVSALLHSSTMVAAGAWLLIRLHQPLADVAWFGTAAIIIGLATAFGGGITAMTQTGAKKLLAASTSAQYGLMFTAVGAGYASTALAHLITHAACKALLFLAAGSAIHMASSHKLSSMRLGRRLPVIAAGSWVGALALAAVPPLGAAWSKEKIIAASGHHSMWLALTVMAAATLSSWYALRFQTLAYGRSAGDSKQRRSTAEQGGVWLLAAGSLALGLLWIAGESTAVTSLLPGELPKTKMWEIILSSTAVVTVSLISWSVYRRPRVARRLQRKKEGLLASWWGMPQLIEMTLVRPCFALAAFCADFDRRIVDGGVRGAAAVARFISRGIVRLIDFNIDAVVDATAKGWLQSASLTRLRIESSVDALVDSFGAVTGSAASSSRRLQPGSVPIYLVYLSGGLIIVFLTFILGAW